MNQISVVTAWMWAIIAMVVFFLLAVVVANAIPYKPNNPGTTSRRIWFWVLAVLSPVVGFIINFTIAAGISVPSVKDSFISNAAYAAGATFIVYILVGFIISKMFPKAKVGTWF